MENNIIIRNILQKYSATDIAEILYNHNILKANKITIVPGNIYNDIIIEVNEFYINIEKKYHFIEENWVLELYKYNENHEELLKLTKEIPETLYKDNFNHLPVSLRPPKLTRNNPGNNLNLNFINYNPNTEYIYY